MGGTSRRRAAERRRRVRERAAGTDGLGAADPTVDLVAEVRQAVTRVAVSHTPADEADEQVDRLVRRVGSRPPSTLAAAVDRVLGGLTEQAGRGGWPPEDLRELVRRQLGPAHVPTLDAVGPGRPAAIDAGRTDRPRLASCLRVAAQLTFVPLLVDPPAPSRAPGPNGQAHPRLARVRALLAKAESTDYDEEAEALTAKAQELISRYSLEALLAEDRADDNPGLATRRLWLDPPYVGPKSHLVAQVARVNRCRMAVTESLGYCLLVGRPADLTAVELVVTSLLVQADAALLRHGRRTDRAGRSRTRSFRHAFLLAYAIRVGERLRETERATLLEVDPGGDLLPVLRDQERQLGDAFAAMLPHLRQRSTSSSNRDGWHAGRAAAEQARLGVVREVGAERRALSPPAPPG